MKTAIVIAAISIILALLVLAAASRIVPRGRSRSYGCRHRWSESDIDWDVQGDMSTAIHCLYNTHVKCELCGHEMWIGTEEYARHLRDTGRMATGC